ncbi:MAG TPA: secondary thiamine-phosphate synthase enzyme YjbQ [Longimicrobium sp.]|nr:secondary thiamine-phosphate synthase enzyme YjbQ [Longimicrobium sp.]
METVRLSTRRRAEMVDVTRQVHGVVDRSGVREGIVVIQSLHTTAGITVNENADPDVQHDMLAKLERVFPHRESFYQHAEGNSDSHLKTSFMGPSVTLIVHDGRVLLGRWQGVYFCEFDGPRERQVAVQVIGMEG